MATVTITLNGTPVTFDADPEMPLLWALRDVLSRTGTKYGCGVGVCGSCVVHVDGREVRSCVTPVADVDGHTVTTIEGLASRLDHPLVRAWLDEDVPQCGYCQPGYLMAAAALLERVPRPTDTEIDAALADHVCRCGTYVRIRRAVHRAAGEVGP